MLILKEIKKRDLLNKSDNRSTLRSLNLRPQFQKIIGDEAYYIVSSTSSSKDNIVIIKSEKINEDIDYEELKDIINHSDIKVACSCENFLYRGYKYILWKIGGGIDRETRPPRKMNRGEIGCCCKHIISVLRMYR